ncbi:MAG TPA: biopolymer transporter ExbD [Spirochaetota bacterium]|nr:biopolymer transporter ExbD [Spirochaetota bacterium]
MNFKTNDKKRARFDLTPMIDVVFLLLIFFMVSSSLIKTKGMDVNVPSSRTADPEKDASVMVVTITRSGKYYVNNSRRPITLRGLENKIRQLRAAGYNKVVIRSDAKVGLQQVVDVMDVSRMAKMKKISIATKNR